MLIFYKTAETEGLILQSRNLCIKFTGLCTSKEIKEISENVKIDVIHVIGVEIMETVRYLKCYESIFAV